MNTNFCVYPRIDTFITLRIIDVPPAAPNIILMPVFLLMVGSICAQKIQQLGDVPVVGPDEGFQFPAPPPMNMRLLVWPVEGYILTWGVLLTGVGMVFAEMSRLNQYHSARFSVYSNGNEVGRGLLLA